LRMRWNLHAAILTQNHFLPDKTPAPSRHLSPLRQACLWDRPIEHFA
jgi:hypothetical protein